MAERAPPAMIEVDDLWKRYGPVAALRGVSFEVRRGVRTGFLGPNGAGKSTTLRILAGFLGATSGIVRVAGWDLWRHRLEAVQNIGYMPETSPLYPEMRVAEYLRFRAALKGVRRRQRPAEAERAMRLTRIYDRRRMLVRHLSKGYRQRVGLADALLGRPPLLILDEPTAGLDPNQIRQVRGLLDDLREDHTILISTHVLSEVEATCDEAIVLHRGRVAARGSIDELRQRTGLTRVEITLRRSAANDPAWRGRRGRDRLEAWFRDPMGLASAVVVGPDDEAASEGETGAPAQGGDDGDGPETWRLTWAPGASASPEHTERVVGALCDKGVGVRSVRRLAASLEQVFEDVTGGSDDEDDDDDEDEDEASIPT
ncbi:MAG: ABC transporter ATP-binding protein [Myxococcota bacterium]